MTFCDLIKIPQPTWDTKVMHVVQLLHTFCKKSCVGIHTNRLKSLFSAVSALVFGGKLSLAGLGRSLKTGAKVKNNIKCIDRLLGNSKLLKERDQLYSAVIKMIIGNTKSPSIIVDWSPLPDPNFYLLRASVPTQGRSLSIYEEVHSLKKQNNHKVHKAFLQKLNTMLTKNCKPIIIVDAGFYSPFFQEVVSLGWNWLGRIRNSTQYCPDGSNDWIPCKTLYRKATKTPQFVCNGLQSKRSPIECSFFIFKGKKKGRIAKGKLGKRKGSSHSKKHAKGNKEPWVIATSLTGGKKISKKVILLYKRRMQIEESFRDIKNSRLGFSLEHSKTSKAERFEILLLIGMLAILAVSLIGKAGEQRGIQYDFQANTIRHRAVLSLFFLGCQIIRQTHIIFKKDEILMALKALRNSINQDTEI